MMINTSLKMNLKEQIPDPKSQYRYRKQKRIPVFPQLLYDMLENAEERGYDHIFSWMPDGKSFKIHLSGARCSASERIIVQVLKSNNFQQSKFRSFLRQLNQYGFERTQRGKGEFRHEFFVRGKRELLEGKSIEDFQQPQDYHSDIDEDADYNKGAKSFYKSVFLESDQSNYWKPSSANARPNHGIAQETAWQMYAKSLVTPPRTKSIPRQVSQETVGTTTEKYHHQLHQQNDLFVLPPALRNPMPRCSDMPSNEWNDDDTIPTIDSGDSFDEFMTSEFDMMLMRQDTSNRFPCHIQGTLHRGTNLIA